ncbi:NAD(P)-dependent oxidoreductase [Actinoalloteichus sp. AHMU CJ021]|uniref:NAD(P)H-binding protein n=1 Tax=Actinoalloteichus TaxID=65496 RepID=UPI000423B077|nr:NAD(P)H-binding protein [Actinoalloteichus caeruleus]AUS81649.1 NAD(P)-dependent oxidoreductase [Actinoalloteichus sp. AHMU CJ021]
MILVTGATGAIGGNVLRLLAGGEHPVRALSRTPSSVPTLSGVEAVQGDFTDPDSLRRALDGVSAVLLVTVPNPPTVAHDVALLDAAVSAGVRRVVKLSAIGTGEWWNGQLVGSWHQETEDAVRGSGLDWTVLRPSTFASNTLGWARSIAVDGVVPDPVGGARQGVIDPRDVAGVAVAELVGDHSLGRTLTLTGPELISAADQAEVLGRLLGRTLRVEDLPLPAMRGRMEEDGWDSTAMELAVAGTGWARSGGNAVLTRTVEEVLGRPAATFEKWAVDHLSRFGG